jgi:hypothetical protein
MAEVSLFPRRLEGETSRHDSEFSSTRMRQTKNSTLASSPLGPIGNYACHLPPISLYRRSPAEVCGACVSGINALEWRRITRKSLARRD